MNLITGLGNPDKQYNNTRHNIGFKTIERLVQRTSFPKLSKSKKFKSYLAKGILANKEVVCQKPTTYMNNSGRAVKKVAGYYNIPPENIVVIHDDLDLPLGEMKISKNRGHGGHNGVISVIEKLGTKNFIRIRLGIDSEKRAPGQGKKFVLQKFNKKENKTVEEVTKNAAQAIEIFLKEDLNAAMKKFN